MSTYLETLTTDLRRELVALNVPEQEAGERARAIAMDRILRDPSINADAAFNESDHPREGGKFIAQIAAAGNGHVTGEGTDADGKPTTESTKDHPKTVTAEVEVSSIGALFNALRRF
jgi:hypothetical protein